MTDGCWVQFWDDKACTGATLRFDTDGTLLRVADLDAYTQSNGAKEGNEPDSLTTGSRTWLVVSKDKDFQGGQASFGPNTRIDDLDVYKVGGNISSFEMFDSRPVWFVDSTIGSPFAYEADDESVDAATVNNFFRTVVAAGLNLIPVVGGAIGTLVGGLWPDVDQTDQVWGSFQNYLNQVVAGVYWQINYELLNETLENLYKAATRFVSVSEEDRVAKTREFSALYNAVNGNESYFIDEKEPQRKFFFMVAFGSLRLATLRENLQHYKYYYGSEPSQQEVDRLTKDIQESIKNYQDLLMTARTNILEARRQLISVVDDVVIDHYNGARIYLAMPDELDTLRGYAEGVWNRLALKLDQHIATSQLWPHFDPDVTGPIQPPVLEYVDGPLGYYWYDVPDFSQMEGTGRISGATVWTGSDGANPAQQNGLELYVDKVGQGRVCGEGGTADTMSLGDGSITEVNCTGDLRLLSLIANTGDSVAGGDPSQAGQRYRFVPLADTLNGRLTGLSGSAGIPPAQSGPKVVAAVNAICVHWTCELPIERPSSPKSA